MWWNTFTDFFLLISSSFYLACVCRPRAPKPSTRNADRQQKIMLHTLDLYDVYLWWWWWWWWWCLSFVVAFRRLLLHRLVLLLLCVVVDATTLSMMIIIIIVILIAIVIPTHFTPSHRRTTITITPTTTMPMTNTLKSFFRITFFQ